MWNNFKYDVLYHHWSGRTSVGFHSIMLKKHQLFLLTNVTDSFFQSLWGLHVILRVDFHTFDHVLLVNDASVVPENGEHHFPAEGWVLNFYFLGEVGWQNSSDWLFNSGHSDAPNSCPLRQCCTENHYSRFCSQQVIANMLSALLSSFQAHTFSVTQTRNNLIDITYTNV